MQLSPESLKEFQDNLKKVSDFTAREIETAMEVGQSRVMRSAKANHMAAPKDGSHPDPRYYDRTAKLTNSIRVGEIEATEDHITGVVNAGGGVVDYATAIELGTPTHRAYPFLQPALEDNADSILFIFADAVKKALA